MAGFSKKNIFYVSRGTVLGRFFQKKTPSFSSFDKKNLDFTGKILAGLSKLLSSCPEEQLDSNNFERTSLDFSVLRIIN